MSFVYAVRGGPSPGIYMSWDDAKKHSSGLSGALCKKFREQSEAESWLRGDASCSLPTATPPAAGGAATASFGGVQQGGLSQRVAGETNGRIYLEVPFNDKDEAKALGARWDPQRRKWFAQSLVDREALRKWPEAGLATATPHRPRQIEKSFSATLGKRKSSEALDSSKLSIFTDGSCKGNTNVAKQACDAGWGVLVTTIEGSGNKSNVDGTVTDELYGPVVTDSASDYFLGAEVGSNNTGELSAVCEALLWLRDHEGSSRPVTLYYDSKYAANIASGKWNAEKNKQLAATAQTLFREVQETRQLSLEHVKGHSGHPLNDHVDRLAKMGAAGKRCFVGRYAPGNGQKGAGAGAVCMGSNSKVGSEAPAKRPRLDHGMPQALGRH